MTKRTLEPPLLGIAGAYFLLFSLAVWPVTDFVTTVLPFQMGRVEWRFGSLGIMAVYVTTPIMGIAMAMVLAFFLRHRLVLRLLSILCLSGAVFLMLSMLTLALAIVQFWGLPVPEGVPSLRTGGVLAMAKHSSAFIALLLLGLGGWQAGRRMDAEKALRKDSPNRLPLLSAKAE